MGSVFKEKRDKTRPKRVQNVYTWSMSISLRSRSRKTIQSSAPRAKPAVSSPDPLAPLSLSLFLSASPLLALTNHNTEHPAAEQWRLLW